MANPIIRGFSKLTQFSGRDTRGEFWPYAGTVFAMVMILGGMAGAVVMSRIVAEMVPYAQAPGFTAPIAPSDQVMVEVVGPSEAPPLPMPDFTPFFLMQGVIIVLTVGLLAAAISRRLHDTGRSAFWGLMPVPFLFGGIFGMMRLILPAMNGGVPDFGLFGLMFLNNMAYLAALVTLIFLLAQPGSPRPNRHGEARMIAPVRPTDDWSVSS